MSPTPQRQAVIVGLFVTAGIAILVGGILTIGNLNDTFTRKVTVTAVFDEVSGLTAGDNIWFSGLKVGIVTKLRFQGDSQVAVEMKVDEDATLYIHQDALAKIGSDGLIGSRIVVLYGGTAQAPLLQDGDVLAIGETVSTEAIMATLQANNENLLAVTTDLKVISSDLAAGKGTLGRLLQDDALYDDVSQTVAGMHAASDNAVALTASLADFSADLNRAGGLPKDIVTDRTTYAALTTTVAHLQEASEHSSTLMGGLARGAADSETVVGTLVLDNEAGADLKATLDNLNDSSRLLAEDLEAAQHSFLLRHFFKKKERAAARAAAESSTVPVP